MTPRQSIILACIGLAIIVLYVVYLGIYFGFSKPTKAQERAAAAAAESKSKSTSKSAALVVLKPDMCNNIAGAKQEAAHKSPEPIVSSCPSCPKAPSCPPQPQLQLQLQEARQEAPANCIPDYDDAATRLTQSLMTSAKKVTTDQGLDDMYYHQLLAAIYKRFYLLNKTLLDQGKSDEDSLKFLRQLKTEIEKYEAEEKRTPKAIGQAGGNIVNTKDIKAVIDSNEGTICKVYTCLT
jgi:hypothetical protein